MVNRLNITSVLPLKDPVTGKPKKFRFANGTKSMDLKAIVYIFDSVDDCTEDILNTICTNLVSEFNTKFDIKIAFGGFSAKFGAPHVMALADIFLLEDVVNLAMMSYLDSVQDGTFFADTELIAKYFGTASDSVFDLFRDYLPE